MTRGWTLRDSQFWLHGVHSDHSERTQSLRHGTTQCGVELYAKPRHSSSDTCFCNTRISRSTTHRVFMFRSCRFIAFNSRRGGQHKRARFPILPPRTPVRHSSCTDRCEAQTPTRSKQGRRSAGSRSCGDMRRLLSHWSRDATRYDFALDDLRDVIKPNRPEAACIVLL